MEEPAKCIGVPMHIASSVLDARMNDIKLEGKDMLKDVRVRRRELNGRKSAKQVHRFCQGLVEEVEAGEGREPEGPELCEMEERERRCKSVRDDVERGRNSVSTFNTGSHPLNLPAR